MEQQSHFGEVLEAVGTLSPDEQLTLVDIGARRLAEEGRKRIVADVQQARKDFAEGRCEPTTVERLRDEIFS